MNENEVLNNNITETTVQSESTTLNSENVENKNVPSEEKSYTSEELKKEVQSASSKAKNDILKALGISSVKEFQDLKSNYENTIKDTETLKSENEKLNNMLVLNKLNVREDVSDDFIDLTKKRMTGDKSFSDAAAEVIELYPNMTKNNNIKDFKIGTEKNENKTTEQKYSSEMIKRYPWLANFKN